MLAWPTASLNCSASLSLSATDRFRASVDALARPRRRPRRGPGPPGRLPGRLGEAPSGRVLGVSQPAAVKVADRLAADGLLERRPGADGRHPGPAPDCGGRRAARRVLADRAGELDELLAVLDAGRARGAAAAAGEAGGRPGRRPPRRADRLPAVRPRDVLPAARRMPDAAHGASDGGHGIEAAGAGQRRGRRRSASASAWPATGSGCWRRTSAPASR